MFVSDYLSSTKAEKMSSSYSEKQTLLKREKHTISKSPTPDEEEAKEVCYFFFPKNSKNKPFIAN